VITLIHGPAELERSESLQKLRTRIGADADLVDLNSSHLDGRSLTLADLQFACESMPFLADRRLIIVTGLSKRLVSAPRGRAKASADISAAAGAGEEGGAVSADQPGSGGQKAAAAILDFLAHVPETAELVLVEDEMLPAGPLLRRLTELQREGRATIIACVPPRGADLTQWIRARAKKHQIQLDPAALSDLAEFVGDDLRQLDQELMKLRDYKAGQPGGSVTRADVRQLVTATRAANVFDMVEALGAGNAQTAARLLHHALYVDGEEPLRLLALISRQYRQLLQAKALQAEHATPAQVARQVGVPDWKAGKLLSQANRYSMARLQQFLEYMVAADEAIKTGKMTDHEALDVLLTQLTAARGS
jgi:DNA polymerase-3 subunit delta